jgi:hypothetical protein
MGVVVGCGATGPTTEPTEADSVRDIHEAYNAEMEGVELEARLCSESGEPQDYQACFQQNGVPVREQGTRTAIDALDRLQQDVGPDCTRALRRASLNLGGDSPQAFSAREGLLQRTEQECRRESQS